MDDSTPSAHPCVLLQHGRGQARWSRGSILRLSSHQSAPHHHCQSDTPASPVRPRPWGKPHSGNQPKGAHIPEGPLPGLPAQPVPVPLATELSLSQDVVWQGVQRRLQQRAGMSDGLRSTKLSQCQLAPSPQKWEGLPYHQHKAGIHTPSPSCSHGTRSTAAR